MSFKAQQAVVDAFRDAGYIKVDGWCLLFIARRLDNDSKRGRVSLRALAHDMRKSESSIQRYIKNWITRGVLSRLRRGGHGMATLYFMDLKELSTWADHRSHRNDRRLHVEMTGDASITGQDRPDHRLHRSDRQSDNRSFRSNESSGDVRRRRRSPDEPGFGPTVLRDVLRNSILEPGESSVDR